MLKLSVVWLRSRPLLPHELQRLFLSVIWLYLIFVSTKLLYLLFHCKHHTCIFLYRIIQKQNQVAVCCFDSTLIMFAPRSNFTLLLLIIMSVLLLLIILFQYYFCFINVKTKNLLFYYDSLIIVYEKFTEGF